MDQRDRTAGANRRIIDFENNRLAGSVYGQYDQHLARLEQKLGITIISRGNRLALEGPHAACETGAAVLAHLYQRVKEGLPVGMGEVDAAIRLVEQGVDEDSEEITEEQGLLDLRGGFVKPEGAVRFATRNKVITPRTPRQAQYMQALLHSEMVFGIGPAGTGKTYLAVGLAVAKLCKGEIERIVLSRPAVEAGENLGFLPGDLKDKVDPYLRPLYDALYDMLPADQVVKRLQSGQIEVAPLAFMRGRTLSNAVVILDEAQNTTQMQMKMFLTRFGENCRMVICGDPSQIDLPKGQQSGLVHAQQLLSGVEGIRTITFQAEDVVRHPLVGRIVAAYEKEQRAVIAPKERQ